MARHGGKVDLQSSNPYPLPLFVSCWLFSDAAFGRMSKLGSAPCRDAVRFVSNVYVRSVRRVFRRTVPQVLGRASMPVSKLHSETEPAFSHGVAIMSTPHTHVVRSFMRASMCACVSVRTLKPAVLPPRLVVPISWTQVYAPACICSTWSIPAKSCCQQSVLQHSGAGHVASHECVVWLCAQMLYTQIQKQFKDDERSFR